MDAFQTMLKVEMELLPVAEEEIITHVERWALSNSDDDISENGDEIYKILQNYCDDFVEHYFVFEDANFSERKVLHEGYRPEKKNKSKRSESYFGVSFSAIQPSKDEIEKLILFYISTFLR